MLTSFLFYFLIELVSFDPINLNHYLYKKINSCFYKISHGTIIKVMLFSKKKEIG
jgi:hypothetical protein